MEASLGKFSLVAVFSMVLLVATGCSSKWLQGDGEQTSGSTQSAQKDRSPGSAENGSGSSGWNGEGVNPNFPGTAQGGSHGELSGFSQNPSDEYLSAGSGITSVSPTTMGSRNHVELTKEEKAAIEAGLQDVFFGYDQWTLSDAGMEALNRNASWLKDHPGAVMKVEGHCDERGTAAYNIVLGDKRSKSARSYLVESGVTSKQVTTISYGKERPFCLEHDEACYQQNRRGHMLLTVKKK